MCLYILLLLLLVLLFLAKKIYSVVKEKVMKGTRKKMRKKFYITYM